MGEIVGAGLLAHVPTIMMPREARLELNEGKEITLVTGLEQLPADVFDHIDQLSAPRLVEYWEQDPCARHAIYPRMRKAGGPMPTEAEDEDGFDNGGVKVEARFAVGEYQIVILSAKEANGLEAWLLQNHYNIPKGAASALAPYIQGQQRVGKQVLSFTIATIKIVGRRACRYI